MINFISLMDNVCDHFKASMTNMRIPESEVHICYFSVSTYI